MTSFTGAEGARIEDSEYFEVMLANVEQAQQRIWLDMFLFDIRPARDVRGRVLELAMALVDRFHSGVDVRVLLTGLVRTPALGVANVATGLLLDASGVPHRRVFDAGNGRGGSHAKLVIVDDIATVGSQNWSDDAFGTNHEDAVMLKGPVVDILASDFIAIWRRGRSVPRNAAS